MESFTAPSAAAGPTEAPLDQASFTEMFHLRDAVTPTVDPLERFRDPSNGQFQLRNLTVTVELCATEHRLLSNH